MNIEEWFKFDLLQSKIIIVLGIISILVTSDKEISIIFLLAQFFAYWALARGIQCQVYGGCILSSWISLIIPIFGLLISVLYRLSKYQKFKKLRKYRIKLLSLFRNNDTNIEGDGALNLNNVIDLRNNSFIKLD